MSDWKLDGSCVEVKEAKRICYGCGDDVPITHFVQLDMGSETTSVFEGCKPCADDFAARLIEALPEPQPEES